MAGYLKGRFTGVLLTSDFDGTFVPSTKIVQEDVKEALRYFIKEGGLFTVSTGRTYMGFHAYSSEYINAPVLLANGGMAFDYARNEVILERGIGDEGLEPISAVAEAFPHIAIELFPMNQAYAIHFSSESERHFTSQGIPFSVVDKPEDAPRPWIKAMLNGDNSSIGEVQMFLKERCPQVNFLPTKGRYLEILGKGVDKGTSVRMLADRLEVDMEHVYCAGDGYNDVEMLQAAHKAFVPENGDEEALKCADYVVRTSENGCIAHVVEILDEIYR